MNLDALNGILEEIDGYAGANFDQKSEVLNLYVEQTSAEKILIDALEEINPKIKVNIFRVKVLNKSRRKH